MIILQTVGLLGRVISPSQGLYLNTVQYKHRIDIYTHQTPKPCVGFEPTIPATVTGTQYDICIKLALSTVDMYEIKEHQSE
jgi:hypothetical protein